MSTFSDDTDAALAAERGFAEAAALTAKNTIDGLRADIGDRDIRIAALDADLAQLHDDFDAYKVAHPDDTPPPPPPPPTGALIGATCGSNDGGLNITADIRRTYNAAALPADFGADASSADASRRAVKGGIVWTSYKGPMSDAALRAALKSMADYLTGKGQSGWVTFEHEPDIKGAIPLPTYHAGYDQLDRVIAEFPNLQPIVCLTGYTGDRDPTVWETYSRPGHKMIGADHYNRGHQQTGKPLLTPAENYGKLVAFAKGKGKPLCIGETGARTETVPGPVIKTRADWYRAHRAYVLDPANGIAAACAYDSGLGLLDAASAHAWYAL